MIDFKAISLEALENTTTQIQKSYYKLYDLAENYENREAIFLKELVDILLQIDAVTYVYTRDGKIHPDYVLEKLNTARSLLTTNISFWENKLKEVK